MNNIENIMNELLPITIKYIILIGIIMCLASITSIFAHKKVIKQYMLYTLCPGALLILLGLIVNFCAGFEIDFNSYKYSIPLGYIVSFIIFFLIIPIINKKEYCKSKKNKEHKKK